MNIRKSTTKPLMVFLMIVTITFSLPTMALAETGMTLEAKSLKGSTELTITGKTTKQGDVSIIVKSPLKNVVFIDQITPDNDGNFATTIHTSNLWKQNGIYTITAQQGAIQNSLYTLSVNVEVNNGLIQSTKSVASSMVDQGIIKTPESEGGISVKAIAVPGSTTIGIEGHTSSLLNDITITVKAPNGNIVTVEQVRPDINGDFEANIKTTSSLWKQDGVYTITVQQGESSQFRETVQVEIADGAVIPEFGTIAAMILAVAIVSIIAISARSRLSIMPKY